MKQRMIVGIDVLIARGSCLAGADNSAEMYIACVISKTELHGQISIE